MKQLWAPWRMEFIVSKKPAGCVLCNARNSKNDRKKLVLYRDKNCFIIMNKYPYNNGHIMICPNKHEGNLSKLKPTERTRLFDLCSKSMKILATLLKCQGFNCGMNFGTVSGAGITDHLHLHVVPRWLGDTNFMPIIGKTKSMPEYLESTYNKLLAAFRKIG